MIHILHTHPVVWHLENNPRLSAKAAAVLSDPNAQLVLPTIVLAEIHHLYGRKRIRTSPNDIRRSLMMARNCTIYPLDEAVLDLFPSGLEIHDAIVVATTLLYRDLLMQPVQLLTADRDISASKLVPTLW